MKRKWLLFGGGCVAALVITLLISRPAKQDGTDVAPDELSAGPRRSGSFWSPRQDRTSTRSGDAGDSVAVSSRSRRPAPWLQVQIDAGMRDLIESGLWSAESITDLAQRRAYLDGLIAGLATLHDVYSAMAVCEELDASADRRYLMLGILSRWVALRPQEAAAWAESQPVDTAGINSRRLEALHRVAVEWAVLDPFAALRWAESLAVHDTIHPLADVYETWSATAPGDMAQWLSGQVTERGREMPAAAVSRLVKNWSASDPAAAAAWAAELPSGSRIKDNAVRAAMLAWAREDSASALAFAEEELPVDRAEGQSARAILAAALARDNPAEALRVAGELDGLLRRARMLDAFKALAITDPHAAQAYFNQMEDDDPMLVSFGPYVASTLADEDFEAAMRALAWTGPKDGLASDRIWQLGHDDAEVHQYEDGFRIMLQTWSARDPVAALTWMADHTEYVVGRATVLTEAVSSWAKQEPVAAAQWAVMLPDEFRQDAVRAVAEIWARQDAATALGFVMDFKNPADKAAGMGAMARHIIEQEPVRAAQLFQSGQLQFDAETVGDLASIWGRQDPQAAARWLDSVTPGASRDAAIRTFTESWFRLSPSQAEAWVARLPAHQDREAARAVITRLRAQLQ